MHVLISSFKYKLRTSNQLNAMLIDILVFKQLFRYASVIWKKFMAIRELLELLFLYVHDVE